MQNIEFQAQNELKDYFRFGCATMLMRTRLLRRAPVLAISLLTVASFAALSVGALAGSWVSLISPLPIIMTILLVAMILISGVRTVQNAMRLKLSGQPHIIQLDNNGIATRKEDGSANVFFPWHDIGRMITTPHLIILITQSGRAVFFNKKYLTQQAPQFNTLIQQHMQNIPQTKIGY